MHTSQRRGRTKAALGAAVALALLVTACTGDETAPEETGPDDNQVTPTDEENGSEADYLDRLIAAAEAEGTLTVYTAQVPDVAERMIDLFREAYPTLSSDVLRIQSTQLAGRFSSEAAAGTHVADVFISSSQDIFQREPELFVELSTLEQGPNFERWPSDWVEERQVIFNVTGHLLTYSTDVFDESEIPDTWEEIVQLDLSDAALMDPGASNLFISFYKLMRDQYGDAFLEQLAADGPTFVDSGVTSTQAIAAGAYSMSFPTAYVHTVELIAEGAPVAVKELTPGHGGYTVVGIPANAPHPAAAQLFLEWFLSEEAQTANCQQGYSPVGFDSLEGCPPLGEEFHPMTPLSEIPDYEEAIIRDLLGLG